jgi:hypothetical protein
MASFLFLFVFDLLVITLVPFVFVRFKVIASHCENAGLQPAPARPHP